MPVYVKIQTRSRTAAVIVLDETSFLEKVLNEAYKYKINPLLNKYGLRIKEDTRTWFLMFIADILRKSAQLFINSQFDMLSIPFEFYNHEDYITVNTNNVYGVESTLKQFVTPEAVFEYFIKNRGGVI